MRSTYSRKSFLGLRISLTLSMAFFFLQLLPMARADSHVRIVRLSYLNGDVQADRGDGQGFDNAILNMPIIHGSRVWTRNDGQAEIEFEDGSTVRLAPNAVLNFEELSLTSSGDRISKLGLEQGTAYFDLNYREHDVFQVSVAHQAVEPLHSTHFRIEVGTDAVNIAVFKGSLRMTSSTIAQVEIRKGETLTLDNTDPGRYFLAKKIDAEYYDTWDNERREYRDRYAAEAKAQGGISYGYVDLNYYGVFADFPGCGNCWRPHSVALGWDPFHDGSWVYYPNFGWTFVSAYPWGWVPYRYGEWVFVSGYGYCWRPGHGWNTWNPTPVVVTATRGPFSPTPHPIPRPPSNRPSGGNPGVVAVGRGPTTGSGGPGQSGFIDEDRIRRGPRRNHDVPDDGGATSNSGLGRGSTTVTTNPDGTVQRRTDDGGGRTIMTPATGVAPGSSPSPATSPSTTTATPVTPVRPVIRDEDSFSRDRDRELNHRRGGDQGMRGAGIPSPSNHINNSPAVNAPAPATTPARAAPSPSPSPAPSTSSGASRGAAAAEGGSRGNSNSRGANPK